MEIIEKKIVNVLTNIMTRLDDLEFAQHQHKEMFYKVKKRLLELIYNRKSGIITRQELINVLYNSEVIEPGKIIRCVV